MNRLVSYPACDFDREAVERARRFVQRHVEGKAEAWERLRTYPEEALRAAAAEFAGTLVSRELGGQGAALSTFLLILEEFARTDIGFTIPFVVQCNVTYLVSKSPNIALRDKWLPLLMKGESLGSFALTEPDAGSDAGSIATSANPQGAAFHINGTKSWVVGGSKSDICAIFARSGEELGTRSIGVFLVPTDRAGLEKGAPYEMISGNVASPTELHFKDFPAGPNDILFPAGSGFQAAMAALDVARLGIAAICTGALASALETSILYASKRKLFGEHSLDKQGLQWGFAGHLTSLEASRALLFQSASLYDSGRGDRIMSAHAKKVANLAVFDGIAWAMRAMGAAGTLRTYNLARQFASAQLLFNTDGTPEVLDLLIARKMLSWAKDAS